MSTTTSPVKVLRARGVSVSIFENDAEKDGKAAVFYKASVRRSYREGDEIKHTASLGRDDLPIAAMLIGKAWEFVLQAEAAAFQKANEESQSSGNGSAMPEGGHDVVAVESTGESHSESETEKRNGRRSKVRDV